MRHRTTGRLEGRVAVITGAATGIGAAIAELYGAEGAAVVVGDVRQEEGTQVVERIRSNGATAEFFRVDVTKDAEVRELCQFAERTFGGLDVLTANAGVLGSASGEDISVVPDEQFNRVLDINVGGTLRAIKHAAPILRRSNSGAITITASTAAHRGYSGLHVYSASKTALLGIIRSVAVDLAPHIRVNGVSPGSVDTDFRAHSGQRRNGEALPDHSMPGVASPADIAHVHLFLASDESRFVSGQTIIADRAYQMHGTLPGPSGTQSEN